MANSQVEKDTTKSVYQRIKPTDLEEFVKARRNKETLLIKKQEAKIIAEKRLEQFFPKNLLLWYDIND